MRRPLLTLLLVLSLLSGPLGFVTGAEKPAKAARGKGEAGGGGQAMLLMIVKDELKLSNDQLLRLQSRMIEVAAAAKNGGNDPAKKQALVQERLKKIIDEVLTPPQKNRLQEILLQVRGPQAMAEPALAKTIGLSEDQVKQLRSLLQTTPTPTTEEERTKLEASLLAVLTDEQRAKFQAMQGTKFDVSKMRPKLAAAKEEVEKAAAEKDAKKTEDKPADKPKS